MDFGGPNNHFGCLTSQDVARCLGRGSVVVLPIGSMEQHGPHLPIATDYLTVDAVAREVIRERGRDLDLWLLPTLPYGKSTEHAWAAGTLTLTTSTLLAVLDDLAKSLAAAGVQKLVLLNGHGGNSALLDVACRDIHVRHGLLTFLLHPVLPPDHGGPSTEDELHLGIHGGRDETAIMLHLAPHLVHMDQARRSVPEWLLAYRHVAIDGPVRFGWTSHDLAETGVIGDPLLATADYGRELFAGMVRDVGSQLAEVSRFRLGGPMTSAVSTPADVTARQPDAGLPTPHVAGRSKSPAQEGD